MFLELNDIEKEILKRALESFDEELKTVIVRTDRRDVKMALHGEEVVVKKILERVIGHA